MTELKKLESIKKEFNKYKKITTFTSAIRLVIGAIFIVMIILLISFSGYIFYGLLSSIVFLIFIIFSLSTNCLYKKYNHLKVLMNVYDNHEKRRNLKLDYLYDSGQEFIDKEDYKELDLDLFGKKSIYQYLSVCKTKIGKSILAKALKGEYKRDKDYTDLVMKMSQTEDTLSLEASIQSFTSTKEINYDELNSVNSNKIPFKFTYLIPLLCFISTIVYLILSLTLKLNIALILIPILLTFLTSKMFLKNPIFNLKAGLYYDVSCNYLDFINHLKEYEIDNNYFKTLKQEILEEENALKKMKLLYLILSLRQNIIFNVVFNAIFVLDFSTMIFFNIESKSSKKLEGLFNNVGEIETLISLSNIGCDNEYATIPNDSDNIEVLDMKHPLVKNCVSNSITFNGGIILTGSNMSGKTTFMRTLGVNLVLKNAGGIVLAKKFNAPRMNIYTSLRANDLLQEGISTFYAEILRMKKMNQAIKTEKCFILVDEIFKGTNAYERISASLKVIDKFNQYNVNFIISTHDFELCDANNISNYHFNEEYSNDNKISFDYKIKSGKSESKNALYLLKMADIIDE